MFVQRALTPDEARTVEIARKAVAANDTWVDRAIFDPRRSLEGGWSVHVVRQPFTFGGDRLVVIDEHGTVVKYLHGL